jgi:glucose dehydrogenase
MALDPESGAEQWRRSIGLAEAGAVHVGCGDGALVAAWTQGLISRLDPATGETLWQRDGVAAPAEPLVSGGRCHVWLRSGRLLALDVADGALAWEFDCRELVGEQRGQVWREARYLPAVTVGGRIVTGASLDQQMHVVALDPPSGELLWRRRSGRDPSNSHMQLLALHEEHVLLTGMAYTRALAVASGEQRWQHKQYSHGLAAITGQILVLAARDAVLLLDASTGQAVAKLPGVMAGSGIAVDAGAGELRVYALSGERASAWRLPSEHGGALERRGEAGTR